VEFSRAADPQLRASMKYALTLPTDIEAVRRRVTVRMMRGVFRAGDACSDRLPHTGIHRILICRFVHTLGDSLTLTPLLAELATVYPGAEVDVVSGCPIADALYGAFPNVSTIYRLPRHVAGHVFASARTLRKMRRKRYDLVIDPDPQSQSGRLLALSARATHSLGYVGPKKSGTLTHGVAVPAGLHHKAMAPVYLLRAALGEQSSAQPYPQPDLMLTQAELEAGRRTVYRLFGARSGEAGPRIAIFANATRDKLLAHDWWQPFIDTLRERVPGCEILEILPAFGMSMLGDRFPCFYSSDVRKMAAVIANLDAYVSADCGVMHLAWASGTPSVGLFRVTDPQEWGPFGLRMGSLVLNDAPPADVAERTVERLGFGNAASA